jgi:hypothetical protein
MFPVLPKLPDGDLFEVSRETLQRILTAIDARTPRPMPSRGAAVALERGEKTHGVEFWLKKVGELVGTSTNGGDGGGTEELEVAEFDPDVLSAPRYALFSRSEFITSFPLSNIMEPQFTGTNQTENLEAYRPGTGERVTVPLDTLYSAYTSLSPSEEGYIFYVFWMGMTTDDIWPPDGGGSSSSEGGGDESAHSESSTSESGSNTEGTSGSESGTRGSDSGSSDGSGSGTGTRGSGSDSESGSNSKSASSKAIVPWRDKFLGWTVRERPSGEFTLYTTCLVPSGQARLTVPVPRELLACGTASPWVEAIIADAPGMTWAEVDGETVAVGWQCPRQPTAITLRLGIYYGDPIRWREWSKATWEKTEGFYAELERPDPVR